MSPGHSKATVTMTGGCLRWRCATALACALLAGLFLPSISVAAESMRVRVAWGGGTERIWRGEISLTEGTLSQPQPLGIEADESGSMWIERERLIVHQRSARAYDGVDLLLDAPLEASLLVKLTATDDPEQAVSLAIPLKQIIGEFFNKELDDLGNRLLLRRTPGDKLRIVTARHSLVFSPGELLKLSVQPHLLPLHAGSKVSIRAHLSEGRQSREIWASVHETRAGESTAIPLEIPLPKREGVFELVLSATRTGWPTSLRKPLEIKQVVAQRSVQLVVLAAERSPASVAGRSNLSPLVEINPANPSWHEKLGLDKLPRLANVPRLWNGPLSNGRLETWRHPLGELVRLKPGGGGDEGGGDEGGGDEVSWEAYTLPIKDPGRPHVLEVEYPSDIPQTLGISILEPNSAGAIMPIGLDSGIDVRQKLAGSEKPRMLRHRLIFWPRTTMPMVLMTNHRDDSPAVYGKIRVLSGESHLPRAFPLPPGPMPQPDRLLAAYLDRPLFPENFSASESLDNWSGRSLDDWVTFYQGGSRLVEYLNHVGYGGLMMSVLADGSTIYPSDVLQSTPRYDTGVFFASGQDPMRKDVLEMLLRQFDRNGLQLIPMLEFATPLPELEVIRRSGSASVEWIGPAGTTWCQDNSPRRGLAPYYNVLDPRVQEAMLNVLRELAGKYSHHPSFGGISVRLSATGYAQLPDPQWGMDDSTIARFSRDVKLDVPGKGITRFAERAAFLGSPKYAPAWLRWRAKQLSRFYRRMRSELITIRPGAKLYLAGAGMLDGNAREGELRPALPRRTTLSGAMLRVGFDPDDYRGGDDGEGPLLLRPEELIPDGRLGSQAVNLEIKQMSDAEQSFSGDSSRGSLFFHRPQKVRVGSFDQKSPFKPTYTWLVSQTVPSGEQNRQRFVHSLARFDSQFMIDGGWLLPMGQEDSIRDLLAAYRLLPGVTFERIDNPNAEGSSQPVVFRQAVQDNATYVYVVNDAPFKVDASVLVDAPPGSRLEELTGRRQVRPLSHDKRGVYWSVRLRPYDLVAVRFSNPRVKLSWPSAVVPPAVEKTLVDQISKLGSRAAALNNPSPMKVLSNAGFELPPDESAEPDAEQITNWATTKRAGVAIAIDDKHKSGGNHSARISSDGPIACMVSRPFDAPATGRISMSVWLRVADASRQPALRLALEGRLDDRDYYRFAPVGQVPRDGHAPVIIGTEWARYVFQVDDLPLEGLSQLRVRFDLMGAGEVWVDDVQMFDLVFSKRELVELSKMITLAEIKLQNGQLGDCMRLLEGYWPRFLQNNVALPATRGTAASVARKKQPERTAAKPPAKDSGFMGKLKNMLPDQLRF